MAEYLSEFVVNLAMPPIVRWVPHRFAMGDNNAYTFTSLLCDARNPDAELMAGTVSGELVRPDGATVAIVGIKGDTVRQVALENGALCNATPCSVTLPQSCFTCPGRVMLTIKLVDGTNSTQALMVTAVVERTTTDAIVDPGEVIPDPAMILAAAAQALAAAQAANTAAEAANSAASAASAAIAGAVRFDQAQTLTETQMRQARENVHALGNTTLGLPLNTAPGLQPGDYCYNPASGNIDVVPNPGRPTPSIGLWRYINNSASGAVRFDEAQTLTEAQAAQARGNIGAAPADQ